MPILARHAVSLSLAFALGLVLSYFAGQYIYQQIQLGKLTSTNQSTFERGVGYVATKAGRSEAVTAKALEAVQSIDPQFAADLLLAVAQSHASRTDIQEPPIPAAVNDAVAPLMKRLDSFQAIGLYDGLVQVAGIDAIRVSEDLLNSLEPQDDAQLLQVVDLLDTRLLWSRRWAPIDLWVRWLGVLAESESELTQFNTAKRLGELPEAVDNADIQAALGRLSNSRHDTVRNVVLNVIAGYAAISEDPTGYEQLIYHLGEDENKTIARRAWMIVGHLKPLSGFAVNWRDADPFVAEAMLWSSLKTSPENSKPAWDAYDSLDTRHLSYLPLSLVGNRDDVDRLEDSVWDKINLAQPKLAWRHLLAAATQDLPHRGVRDYLRSQVLQNASALPTDQPGDHSWNWQQHAGPLLACAYFTYDRPRDDLPEPGLQLASDLARAERIGSLVQPEDLLPVSGYLEGPTEMRIIASAAGAAQDFEFTEIKSLLNEDFSLISLATVALLNERTIIYNAPYWEERPLSASEPGLSVLSACLAALTQAHPKLISGITAEFLRKHSDLSNDDIRAMTDAELSELGLQRIDALPAMLEAAEAAPPSANRSAEAKLLKLALWMRGDLGDDFTPTAEAMLFDGEVPVSAVLMALLHMKRPAALDYLFGDLATPRPDLNRLFIQERYWHVFRRFIDTSDLQLWLWGDPEAQAFQLEAMRQWYAVNRWKIQQGSWPEPSTEN